MGAAGPPAVAGWVAVPLPLQGQGLFSSPPATGWLFDCVCFQQPLQHNRISKFITQAQIAGESFRDRKLWQLQLLVARGHSG